MTTAAARQNAAAKYQNFTNGKYIDSLNTRNGRKEVYLAEADADRGLAGLGGEHDKVDLL